MAEISARSVLKETLEMHREMLKIASDKYTGLIAKKGMEEQFDTERRKCEVLQDLMIGMQSEGVRREMAKWQRDRMAAGGPPREINSEFRIQNSEL